MLVLVTNAATTSHDTYIACATSNHCPVDPSIRSEINRESELGNSMNRGSGYGGNGSGGSGGSRGDKLRDGPCRAEYKALDLCASKRQRPDEAPMTEKERMQACPSQTDRLIKCIHRHPLFFQQQ